MTPIQAHLRPHPDRVGVWVCDTTIGGVTHTAQHQRYAMGALAHALIDAGVDPNTPMVVTHEGLRGYITWTSLRAAASEHDTAVRNAPKATRRAA